MAPRIAGSLLTLRNWANEVARNRSKISDGWIGDAAHRARKSDHNPDNKGVVRALDLTHDPVDNLNIEDDDLDIEALMHALVAAKDKRIKMLIWNRRIWYPSSGWKKYSGKNPHTMHGHISVIAGAAGDASGPWDLSLYSKALPAPGIAAPIPNPYAKRSKLRLDSSLAEEVRDLQRILNQIGQKPPLKVDGDFGPATFSAVAAFQKEAKLEDDGIVGAYTWEAIDKAIKELV